MIFDRRMFLLMGGGALYAQSSPPLATPPKAIRFPENPIIRPDMPTVGNDINGPSLIMAPRWLEKPLGRYYLYFAGHRGTYIRLAYADRLAHGRSMSRVSSNWIKRCAEGISRRPTCTSTTGRSRSECTSTDR